MTTVVPLDFDLYVSLRWNAAWMLRFSIFHACALLSPAFVGGGAQSAECLLGEKLNASEFKSRDIALYKFG